MSRKLPTSSPHTLLYVYIQSSITHGISKANILQTHTAWREHGVGMADIVQTVKQKGCMAMSYIYVEFIEVLKHNVFNTEIRKSVMSCLSYFMPMPCTICTSHSIKSQLLLLELIFYTRGKRGDEQGVGLAADNNTYEFIICVCLTYVTLCSHIAITLFKADFL